MGRIRPHLTYANVMVTMLAFVVLGGVAVAAARLPKGSVGTEQLKRNAVTQAKIKRGAVSGLKVRDGSLTGADIDVSTLGTVPSAGAAGSAKTAGSALEAAKLGGLSPQDFAGSNRFLYGSRTSTSLFNLTLFELPGGVRIQTDGDNDDSFQVHFDNTGEEGWGISTPGVNVSLPPGESGNLTLAPGSTTATLVIQDSNDQAIAAALQCALIEGPDYLTCFATLSPDLAAAQP
jgi:hypothetical protein